MFFEHFLKENNPLTNKVYLKALLYTFSKKKIVPSLFIVLTSMFCIHFLKENSPLIIYRLK